MSNTNRRRKDDRRAELHRFQHWIETEFEVSTTWHYTARGALGEANRALCTMTAVSVAIEGLHGAIWVVCGEIIMDSKGMKELQSHMEILSRLMLDLQLARMYGPDECEYLTSPPLPC